MLKQTTTLAHLTGWALCASIGLASQSLALTWRNLDKKKKASSTYTTNNPKANSETPKTKSLLGEFIRRSLKARGLENREVSFRDETVRIGGWPMLLVHTTVKAEQFPGGEPESYLVYAAPLSISTVKDEIDTYSMLSDDARTNVENELEARFEKADKIIVR